MFTVKHVFQNGENYHAWSVESYFVDKNPSAESYNGNSRGVPDRVREVMVGDPPPIGTRYPRLTLELAGGKEIIFDAVGTVYVENMAGKTIDVIRLTCS